MPVEVDRKRVGILIMAHDSSKRKGQTKPTRHRRNVRFVVGGMRKTLLSAALSQKTVTYGTLMGKFGLPRGRVLSEMIAETDRREYASGSPGFAAIIVRKDTGYPGGGYFHDDALPRYLRRPASRSSDPRLTKSERDYIRKQQEKIWAHYARANRTRR